jgi:hypothetical protein
MKLTPVELSREPMRFTVETQNYDFSNQQRLTINSQMSITHGGTQTFSERGKPQDRDSD